MQEVASVLLQRFRAAWVVALAWAGAAACVVGQQAALELTEAELARYTTELGQDPWSVLRDGLRAPRQVLDRLQAIDREGRVRLIRAALWSDDATLAAAAVAMLDPYWLDRRELARAAAVAQPFAFGLDNEVYYADLRDWIGRSAVATALGDAPPLPRKDYDHVGQLHRSLRPEHLPLLSRLTLSEDEPIRLDAMRYLHTVAAHSDAARPVVGATLLSWPGRVERPPVDPYQQKLPVDPRSYQLPDETGGGYPRVLAAVLDRLFLRETDEFLRPFDRWARAWAFDTRPDDSDRELLVRLAGGAEDAYVRHEIAARGLADLLAAARQAGDPVAGAARAQVIDALRRLAARSPGYPATWIAVAALHAAGASDASERLVGRGAARRAERFAAWLEVEPDAALDALAGLAGTAGDPDATADLLVDALEAADWFAFRHPADLDERLAERLDPAAVDAELVAVLLGSLPGTRTIRLADHLLEELRPDRMSRGVLAMLEVHGLERLRARLAAWSERSDLDASCREEIRRAWLRVGAPSLGAAAIERLAPDGLERLDVDEVLWFSRSRCAELTARWLLDLPERPSDAPQLDAARLATAFGLLGFDDDLVGSLADDFGHEDQRAALVVCWGEIVAALRGPGAEQALAVWLSNRPAAAPTLSFCGRVDHPVVRADLEARLLERGRRSYLEANVELARLGSASAREELLAAHREGVYFWGDDLSGADRILDGDPEFVRVWRDALQSNCCTCVVAAGALEQAFGVDATAWSETAVVLRAEAVERFIRRFEGRLRSSRVLGRPVVAPR